MRKPIFVFLLVSAVLLSSCSKENVAEQESSGEKISEGTFVNGEIGYFFDSVSFENECAVLAENNRLEIYDYSTKQLCYLCSKPDCKHELYDRDENPDPQCGSVNFDERNIGFAFYADKSIYYCAFDLQSVSLIRCDIDGSNKKELATLDGYTYNYPSKIVITNSCVYFAVSSFNGENPDRTKSEISYFDITTNELGFLTDFDEKYVSNIDNLCFYDNSLYFEYSYADDESEDVFYNNSLDLYRVDCDTKKCEKVAEDIENLYGVNLEGIYYTEYKDKKHSLNIMNLSDGSVKAFLDFSDSDAYSIAVLSDGLAVSVMKENGDEDTKIYDLNLNVTNSGEKYMYINGEISDKYIIYAEAEGGMLNTALVDKDSLFDSAAAYEVITF